MIEFSKPGIGYAEVWPLLQALNNGHDGSMATMYATSPRDALARLEIMATSADPSVPLLNVREQMAGALDLIIQTSRLADGSRLVHGGIRCLSHRCEHRRTEPTHQR